MTDRQRAFVLAYVNDPEFDGARAYMSVYKNCKKTTSAASNASRLLKNADIRAYVDELLEKMESEKIATAAEIQKYLTSAMRGKVEEEVIVVEGCGDGISSATKKKKVIQPRDRIKAAELLGKVHGIFTEKVEVEGKLDTVINVIPASQRKKD